MYVCQGVTVGFGLVVLVGFEEAGFEGLVGRGYRPSVGYVVVGLGLEELLLVCGGGALVAGGGGGAFVVVVGRGGRGVELLAREKPGITCGGARVGCCVRVTLVVAVTVDLINVGAWVKMDKLPLLTCGGACAAVWVRVTAAVAVTVTIAVLVRGALLVSVCGMLRRLLENGAEL